MKKLFVISYSHTFAQKLDIKKLIDRLNNLGVNDFAEVWWDYEIPAGSSWDSEIRTKFETAHGYFVLGSNAYIESDYICNVEWPIIQRRTREGAATLFWTSFDRPMGSYPPAVNLSQFQAAAGRSTPLSEADTPKKKNDFLAQLAEEIAAFLVDDTELSPKLRKPVRQPTLREVEAAYLEALRNQCAQLVSRDRFLPMQQLYVRLKADERTTEERKAGEELIKRRIQSDIDGEHFEISKKTADQIIEEQLKQLKEVEQLPTEASLRFTGSYFSADNLEEIFQRNRFLVVRGGPGSGKTVLCWKIAESMGAGWREEFEFRPIKTIRKITEFGVSRLPVLIPIRDYARACREQNGDVTLAGFIGNHLLKEDSVNAPYFNQFLLKQIEDGRVVLLLDGLDEVPAMDRHQIVESIQIFLRTHISPTLDKFTGDPGDAGGNQLVITSRLAGYELAPITDDAFRHFIIRPFDEKGIEEYCRHWAEMVFSRRTPNHGALADELVAAILRNSSPTVQELAKNPLLLQVLCELAAPVEVLDDKIPGDRLNELPRIRAEIYGQAITVMTNRWKVAYDSVAEKNEHVKRLLEPGKMEELLSYVALEMQRQEVLTRATREQLSGWLELALGKVEGKTVFSMSPGEVTRTTSALLDLVRTHVGVISESAPGVFQFHHLTFQEYLAGKASCRRHDGKAWETAERLGQRLASGDTGLLNQRWREPLLLAFGYLGAVAKIDPLVPQPVAVMKSLRAAWQKPDSEATQEEAALLAASLLLELHDDLSTDLVAQVMRDLVLCYKTWFESGVSRDTTNTFIQALTKLRRSLNIQAGPDGVNPFDSVAANIIETAPELSAPLARIFVDRGWLTSPILTAFIKARAYDQEIWDWPLHKGLRRAMLDRDDLEPKVLTELQVPDASSTIQERNNYDRVLDAWREQLRADAERVARPKLPERPQIQEMLAPVMDHVRELDPATLRRVIALCGGFLDLQCSRWRREYFDLSSFLQYSDAIRDSRINEEPEFFLPRWGISDPIYSIAVYLDTKQGGRSSVIEEFPEFAAQSISHDPSDALLRVLKASFEMAGKNEEKITALLRQLVTVSKEPEIAAEAWVALLASGHAIPMPESGDVAELVRWHCSRIIDELRDPVVRFAYNSEKAEENKGKLWSVLGGWLPTLPESEAVGVFKLVMHTITSATGEPEIPGIAFLPDGESMSPMKLAIWGEIWAARLSGRNDDASYHLAVAMDTMKFNSEPIEVFRQCEAIVGAANMQFVPGAHEGLLAPASFESNEAAVEYFCNILQFICETAGALSFDLRIGLFNEVTSGFFKWHGHPPLMLMLLAEYLGASREEGFAITEDEFKKLQEALSTAKGLDYRLSDEWKLADMLSSNPPPSANRPGFEFDWAVRLCSSDNISTSDGWKAFTIFLAANVARKSNIPLESQEDLWLRLKSDIQTKAKTFPETLATLLVRAGNSGMTINETASRVIETIALIDSKYSRDALACIIPLVSHTTPSEIARLRSWIEKDWHSEIPDHASNLLSLHAALLMAEHNLALAPSWIQPILKLAVHGDDRAQARAVLALGGPVTQVNRGTRRRSVSALGVDTLKEMVNSFFHENADQLYTSFHDIHFDNQEVVNWLRNCKHPTLADSSALSFFFGVGTWTEEALDAFAQWLAANPTAWHDSFVIGYGFLAHYQREEIPAILHDVMREQIESHKVTAYLLSEKESYGIVIEACLQAIAEAGTSDPLYQAPAILDSKCKCISSGEPIESFTLVDTCSALAGSLMQWFDTFPEDCWLDIQMYMDDDRLFELVFHWLVKELKEWSKQRLLGARPYEPAAAYSGGIRNALLSILCVMTEKKRDEFVLLTANLEEQGTSLSTLLSEAAFNGKRRSKMAAITLLSRLPNLDANEVGKVVQSALGDDEQIRNRALQLLPRFREFKVTTAFLDEALAKLKGNGPASVIVAYAKLLTNLVSANQVADAKKRREIMNVLRNAASDSQNIRFLSHLAGSGSSTSPRKVINDGRLDHALLAVMAKSYSNFFKNA